MLAALLMLLVLQAEAVVAMPEASGLRFGAEAKRTRIVIDLDSRVSYAVGHLADPDRLVVDLDEVRWNLPPSGVILPKGLALNFRHGLLRPGKSRLVVDIERPFDVSGSMLLPPTGDNAFYRLVVDIRPSQAPGETVAADAGGGGGAATDAAPPASRPSAPDPAPAATSVAVAAAAVAGTAVAVPDAPVPAPRPGIIVTDRPEMVTASLGGVAAPVASVLDARDPLPGAAPPKGSRDPVTPPERLTVVIDPGHGGADPGATGINGVYEKDVVLRMARELRDVLARSGRYRAVLTRDDDSFIRLRDRIARAREAGGNIFLSVHADSIRTAAQRGASVYTLSETASDEEAARLASAENKADILVGADLSQHDPLVATILIDLAQRDTNNRSIAFADLLAEELSSVTTLLRRNRRFAGFAVLKSPDMPSVLVELGYLSNQSDARNLAAASYRANIGQAILRALDRYFVPQQRP